MKKTKRGRPAGSRNKPRIYKIGRGLQLKGDHHFKVRTLLGHGGGLHTSITNPITLNGGNAYQQRNGWHFTLADLPNLVEFQVLFDSFKITKVAIQFFPASNVGFTGESVQNVTLGVPRMISVIDLNDSNIPSSANNLREYADSKRVYMNRDKTITLTGPRVQNQVYKSTVFSGYSVAKAGQWLDTATGESIPHYGIKTAFVCENNGTTIPDCKIDYEITYWFSCRRQR